MFALRKRQGSMVVLVLFMILILTMYITSLLMVSKQNLFYVGHYKDRTIAREMAYAGVNYVVHELFYHPHLSSDINYQNGLNGFKITFDPADKYHSVNNIDNPLIASVTNFEGKSVPPNTADILVVGYSRNGKITHKIHLVCRRAFHFDKALGSVGAITLYGNILLDGIVSIMEQAPTKGGIHSNFRAVAGEYSVDWRDPATIVVRNGSTISAVPPAEQDATSISPNLVRACPESIRENARSEILPNIDVKGVVNKKRNKPAPDGLISGGDKYFANGLYVQGEKYINKSLVINGDLNLGDGTLYVNGDVTINGGVNGSGSLFATGDVKIRGGNVLLKTNLKNASAIFSGKNITIEGLSAAGYLQALAEQYPDTIGNRYQNFKSAIEGLEEFFQNDRVISGGKYDRIFPGYFSGWNWAKATFGDKVGAIYHARWKLVHDDNPSTPDWDDQNMTWEIPIPEPDDGVHAYGSPGAYIPALIIAIKNMPNYSTDRKAQRIVKGLEEFAFYMRNDAMEGKFHDYTVPWQSQSFDHLMWYTKSETRDTEFARGNNSYNIPPDSFGPEDFVDMFKTFVENNNPLDIEWAGESYLQGVVYAEGNVSISNNLQLIGSIIAKGNVSLKNSSLIYCEEYMKVHGAVGPIKVVSLKEFEQ